MAKDDTDACTLRSTVALGCRDVANLFADHTDRGADATAPIKATLFSTTVGHAGTRSFDAGVTHGAGAARASTAVVTADLVRAVRLTGTHLAAFVADLIRCTFAADATASIAAADLARAVRLADA